MGSPEQAMQTSVQNRLRLERPRVKRRKRTGSSDVPGREDNMSALYFVQGAAEGGDGKMGDGPISRSLAARTTSSLASIMKAADAVRASAARTSVNGRLGLSPVLGRDQRSAYVLSGMNRDVSWRASSGK